VEEGAIGTDPTKGNLEEGKLQKSPPVGKRILWGRGKEGGERAKCNSSWLWIGKRKKHSP